MEIPLSVISGARASRLAARAVLWQDANLRRFLLSECLRVCSGYFSAVALPWLVMQSTGSAGLMGAFIFVSGVPRVALVMVFGGLVERVSPRSLLLAAGLLRAALLTWAALIAYGGITASPAALAVICLGFGLADAIFLPARGAITPYLARKEQITALNAACSALDQLWGLAGPALAGLLITRSAGSGQAGGAAVVLAVSAAAAVLALLLLPARCASPSAHSRPETPRGGSLRALLGCLRRERGLRAVFLMVYSMSVVSATPYAVLMPILAVSRYANGAGALGLLTSALSAGALLGALTVGLIPPLGPRAFRGLFGLALAGFGGSLLVLFAAAPLPAAAIALALSAALINCLTISGISYIQRETPPMLLGRMIGLLNIK